VTNKREETGRPGPWPTALRLLTGRDYSQAELRQRLLDKGFDPGSVDETLQRCLALGYLDDARYAISRATRLMAQGRAVGPRILADLRQHGIAEELACRALDQARAACDEGEMLRLLLERRFPGFDYDSASPKERRRVVHFLQRRGFSLGRIMAQLTRKGIAEHDENR
jgi:regulatory protein